jgi:hypothetical protein
MNTFHPSASGLFSPQVQYSGMKGLHKLISVFNLLEVGDSIGSNRMALKDHKLNNDKYMHQAFDPHHREKLVRTARRRRSLYMILCFIGVGCVAIAGLVEMPTVCCLSLLLSTLAIVVVTKYDTQLLFLDVIEKREQAEDAGDE